MLRAISLILPGWDVSRSRSKTIFSAAAGTAANVDSM